MNEIDVCRTARGLLLVASICITSCATNEMTGRSQIMLGDEATLIAEKTQGFAAMKAQYAAKRQLITSGPTKARIDGITNQLIEQAVRYRPDSASWDWEMIVVDTPEVNAFALPGGRMGIYTGMIKLASSDDEIAQVIGHEIGHALAKHGLEKKTTRQGVGALAGLGSILLGQSGVNTQLSQDALAAGAVGLIAAPNSRTAEREADLFGIELAARAGYDPKAAVSLWKKMGEKSHGAQTGFFDTHPSDHERATNLGELHAPMEVLRSQEMAKWPVVKTKVRNRMVSTTKRPQPFDWLNAPKAARPKIHGEEPLKLHGVK